MSPSLVGGHHEIWIVAVVPHDPMRRHHVQADAVVGDVEEAAQERLIARDALLQKRFTLGGRRA